MDPEATPSATSFWIGVLLGAPILAFGVRGLFAHADLAPPTEIGRFLVGGAVVHDALVLPVVCAVGVAARRVVGPTAWPPVRWGLITTGIVLLVSRPFVGRYGFRPGNPTAISRDYGIETMVVLILVWAAVTAWLTTQCLLRRHRDHRALADDDSTEEHQSDEVTTPDIDDVPPEVPATTPNVPGMDGADCP